MNVSQLDSIVKEIKILNDYNEKLENDIKDWFLTPDAINKGINKQNMHVTLGKDFIEKVNNYIINELLNYSFISVNEYSNETFIIKDAGIMMISSPTGVSPLWEKYSKGIIK